MKLNQNKLKKAQQMQAEISRKICFAEVEVQKIAKLKNFGDCTIDYEETKKEMDRLVSLKRELQKFDFSNKVICYKGKQLQIEDEFYQVLSEYQKELKNIIKKMQDKSFTREIDQYLKYLRNL